MMHVTVYSKDNCPMCSTLIAQLNSQHIPYTELKLHQDFTRESLMEMFPNARAFPVVTWSKDGKEFITEYGSAAVSSMRQFLVD